MSKPKVITGVITFKVNGDRYRAKGAFTYNIQGIKKTKIVGADKVHGHKEEVVASYIEGKITDGDDIDLKLLAQVEGTVSIELRNGKTVSVYDAVYAGDMDVDTEEGEIPVRFEGDDGEEVK